MEEQLFDDGEYIDPSKLIDVETRWCPECAEFRRVIDDACDDCGAWA